MPVSRRVYDNQFSPEELTRISFLRKLDDTRSPIAWLTGVGTTTIVFLIQIPFHGNTVLHALCTYGCIPIGIAVGLSLYHFIDRYTDQEFLSRWDPLFEQRSGTTREHLEAQSEVRRLTDEMSFGLLPIDQQRRIVNKVYRDRGLPEPNNDAR